MTTYFWDMDHTLINNDCDVSWKRFLVCEGFADADQLAVADDFYRQYEAGQLDFDAFLEFQLNEFAGRDRATIRAMCDQHFETMVKRTIYPRAMQMLDEQRRDGGVLVLLTATNGEIARPLAEHLGFDDVVASELEIVDGTFTGQPTGIYCCDEGKAERLRAYCCENELDLADVHYFGDSLSDRYTLELAGHPHAVNPMPALRAMALAKGWDLIDFKDGA